ncbi:H+/gluconate symporter-like permease [Anaerosolibacter carboniphilus]|uniref:H+/gluconate symporter-like permease n=1 Tax=Anaerosolibacter carboniphilus TaxID=1417629 RepID=A0A841KP40_9FIRM|nr:GntP family permease [Anaerosolibacter carboniphilus]MBB6215554.1 H+/gluconate symporter-like permease [Anaerosolibacter carboniphilus]
MGVLGIIISLGLLMYLAYRGITVLILAPILALLAVLLGGQTDLLPMYTEVFMQNAAGYLKTYFPLFLLGAIFGKLMDESGAAKSIAHWIVAKIGKDRAILAIVLSCGILTYGGVSLFVVAFAVYPLAAALFREIGLPKRLIPACIALGSFTFTMTAFPGTPQIQNAIPIPFFKTDAYAAPILGIIAGLIMFGAGTYWITMRAKKMIANGEGYLPAGVTDETAATAEAGIEKELPSVGISILPILLVLVLNFYLSKVYYPGAKSEALIPILEKFGTAPGKVVGIWSIIIALVVAILFTVIVNWKRINVMETVNKGAYGSMLAILNTASEVGYGNVISGLAAFAIVKGALLGISSNPLVTTAVSVNILAGITGSASGGMSIALGAMGETFYNMAIQTGMNPELLHRIATLSCGGLDSMPHNGAVITLLGICGLTHKQSYADIGMVSVVIPLATTVIAVILGSMGIV